MISLKIVLILIILHFIADFILQTDWQAKNKSTNNIALLKHTRNYSCVFLFLYFITPLSFNNTLSFIGVTFVLHTLTDYITSRISSYFFKKGDNHNFFVVIGADQVLHYFQLILTYYILTWQHIN